MIHAFTSRSPLRLLDLGNSPFMASGLTRRERVYGGAQRLFRRRLAPTVAAGPARHRTTTATSTTPRVHAWPNSRRLVSQLRGHLGYRNATGDLYRRIPMSKVMRVPVNDPGRL